MRVYLSYYSYFRPSLTLLLDPLTSAATSSSVALGVVVGGLVALLLVLVIVYLVWRKRRWGAGKWQQYTLSYHKIPPMPRLPYCQAAPIHILI